MSDNKYIIDKDSLTGIANAVRDKLGAGEATTDSQTGDIIYPEDKGYYLKEETVAKISGFGWSKTGYSGNFAQDHAPLINDENWNEAVGEPWYSVEITLVRGKGNFYDMDVSYTGGSQNFTNVTSSTYTVSAPNGSTYFNLRFSNKYDPHVSYGSASLESLVAVFKDAEGKPIRPKQSSYHCLWKTSQNNRKFGTGEVEIPIPLTIDDIRNKITNYLNVPSGVSIPVPLQTHMNWGSSATTDYSSFWYDFDCTNISSLTFKYKALLPYNSNTGVKAKDLKFNLDVYYGSKIWHKSGSNERAGVTAVDNASLCSTEHEIVDFDFPNETAAGEGVYTTGDYSHTINVPNNTWITLNIKLSYGSNSYHKIGQLILYDFSVVPREA